MSAQGHPQSFREGLGDQLRLIVSALTKATGVQRHGNHYINSLKLRVEDNAIMQTRSKPVAQGSDRFILQHCNCPDHRVIVHSEAAGKIKGIDSPPTQMAERTCLRGSHRRMKRSATCATQWPRYRLERIQTIPTNGQTIRCIQDSPANPAGGRKDERGQAIADNIQDRAQTLCEHGSHNNAKPTPRPGSIKEKITQ